MGSCKPTVPAIWLVAATVLAGCSTHGTPELQSQAPVAVNFPISYQRTFQSAAHWHAVAADMAEQIQHGLGGRHPFVTLVTAEHASVFDATFRDMIGDELVRRGIGVHKQSARSASTPSIEIDCRVVRHHWSRPVRSPPGAYIGQIPAIIPVVNLLVAEVASGMAMTTPSTELVLTSRIIENQGVSWASTQVFYVDPGDLAQYSLNNTRIIRVVNR